MSKKYIFDIGCIILIILISAIAVLLAGRPDLDLSLRPSPVHRGLSRTEGREQMAKIIRASVPHQALEKRNVFAADGSYPAPGTEGGRLLPENPYTLIGVLKGKEKKAVFREYTGSVVTQTVGEKLLDGYVIISIDDVSVKLRKGKDRRELRVFHVHNHKQASQREP